jgi:sulfite reductase alpha subunit-like flavoprotein
LQIGDIHLYFGCRNKSLDFLYEEELHRLVKADTISKLHVSFSRDEAGEGIKYVQHNIEKNQDEFVDILFDKKGFLYVCGDAKNMAKNVRETVIKCVMAVKGIYNDFAINYL